MPLSRTRKKKQAKEVELVAAQLAGLSESQFAQLDLPEEIIDEANRVRETRGRSSQRRQLKHLAGLLRKDEAVLGRLLMLLNELDQVARSEKREFHRLEDLRDRLCSKSAFKEAFDEMLELAPDIDRKAISRLARSVHDHDDRRAAREIFRRLRDALTE